LIECKSVKHYEHWLTLGKVIAIIQRVTFLLVHFILPIVSSSLDATTKETISAGKNAEKYTISTLIFEQFSGGYTPDPHAGEGLWRPFSDPTPSVLRRLAQDLRSLHRRAPQIFPGADPQEQFSGYVPGWQ